MRRTPIDRRRLSHLPMIQEHLWLTADGRAARRDHGAYEAGKIIDSLFETGETR